jgi:hypothetical protein
LKIKLKGCHFDTAEVIEADRRRYLTPLKNMTSRIHLKMAEAPGTVHIHAEGYYLEGDSSQ